MRHSVRDYVGQGRAVIVVGLRDDDDRDDERTRPRGGGWRRTRPASEVSAAPTHVGRMLPALRRISRSRQGVVSAIVCMNFSPKIPTAQASCRRLRPPPPNLSISCALASPSSTTLALSVAHALPGSCDCHPHRSRRSHGHGRVLRVLLHGLVNLWRARLGAPPAASRTRLSSRTRAPCRPGQPRAPLWPRRLARVPTRSLALSRVRSSSCMAC